jgi:PAS domain S-box-containing protein
MRHSEIRYRRLFESAKDGVLLLDPATGKIIDANPFMANLLGYTHQELLGKELSQIGLLKDEDASQAAFRELQQKGFIRYEDLPLQAKSGKRREVEIVANRYQENGEQVVQCNIRDITDRKKVERAAQEQARLLDLTHDAIMVRDVEGKISYWNHGAEELYGWPRAEALGKAMHSLLRIEFPVPLPQITAELRQNNRWTGELRATKRDGQRITVLARKALDCDSQGRPVAVLESHTDTTEHARMREELTAVKNALADEAMHLERLVANRTAELSATNQQLESFVYTIAHDLRAPVRSMQGFSAMLMEDTGTVLSQSGLDLAHRIQRSAQFMDALLQDLLAFSQIAKQRIELTSVNLEAVIQSVLLRLENEIKEENARMAVEGPWPLVLAHEPTLGQVLTNLVSNALKFLVPGTPPQIRLHAQERPRMVRVWVEDNGIGIAPEHQDQVFRLFMRLYGEQYSGTGIGLAIVQKGVERMGGRVGVDSTPGQGSRFWFELKKA